VELPLLVRLGLSPLHTDPFATRTRVPALPERLRITRGVQHVDMYVDDLMFAPRSRVCTRSGNAPVVPLVLRPHAPVDL
jgi:hypothetical protein